MSCCTGFAQNLVNNSSMETTTGCGGNGALAQATGWMAPPSGITIADLYTPCASSGNGCSNFNPLNGMGGCSNACRGNNFTGQLAYYTACPNCREYIQSQLISPMVAGTTYLLSFHYKLAPYSRYGCNRMGMYVSSTQPSQATNQPIIVTPQIQGGQNLDKNNWTQLSGTYVATGGETWVTIGVFFNNASLSIFDFGSSASACLLANSGAYYYVDNVWVAPLAGGTPPTCAANTNCPIILPIELLSFDAVHDGKSVHLKWSTSSETNNDHFIIERSQNGETFEEVSKTEAAGNSGDVKNYNSKDEWPYNGLSYYRLKQTDKDGTFRHSETKAVSSGNTASSLSVHPNPADNYIDISFDVINSGTSSIQIHNVLGELVYSNELFTNRGFNQNRIDVSEFKKGVYLISVTGNENGKQVKFIRN
jgi:hypothetical protein